MTPPSDAARRASVLTSNTSAVIPGDEFEAKLRLGRPLRVKLGLDPTAPAVTLGWAVVLRKLRQFQDLGHTAVLIVGDFTARVGDPSGTSETRPRLSKEAVQGYAEHLLGQFERILSTERLEIRNNSEWLESLDMEGVLRLTSTTTVARMLERDDFAKRYAAGRPISVMEFLYPLLQAMDSVAVEADVELGGTDQTFNLLMGREVQREYGQEPQVAMTLPLLEGLDGVHKMSQSLGNYVGIEEGAEEMFGKLMSIPDPLIARYLRLCTDLAGPEIDEVEAGLAKGSRHPNTEKRRMARAVIEIYHGPGSGESAEAAFDHVFKEHALPEDVPGFSLPADLASEGSIWLPKLLVAAGLASSNADGRRLIEGGGVRIDGQAVSDPGTEVAVSELAGKVLQVGRRRFARIIVGDGTGAPGTRRS
ncbi:MAG TPA: tyrosine--tRNA ligase [Actinobacteria bacterium]|nr:tyrosine--tRNA ligase [Actinomycetota bacterium]